MDYWLRDDVLAVLKKHQKHLLLNHAAAAGRESMLCVFDIQGRLVPAFHVANSNSLAGIYLLQIESRGTMLSVKARALIR
jgi:hypothetical protein